jgi:hypothetical protein
MKKKTKTAAILLLLVLGTVISIKSLNNNKPVGAASTSNEKVLICHQPMGNSGNGQSIWVSSNAIPAHLAHGDFVGNCESPLSCQELCEQEYDACMTAANGDPGLLKICESQRKSCLSLCGPAAPGDDPR